MKPTRFLIVAILMLGMVATASAITEEGTVISNQAFGTYKDANGNEMTQVQSLTVETTVSQVAGVDLGGNLASPISAMDSTTYAFTLSNTGNGEDTFTLGATGAANDGGTYNFYVYHDIDGDGSIDDNEDDAQVTTTGAIAFQGDYDLLVLVVDVTSGGGGNAGEEHVVTFTATSTFTGDTTDVITLTSTIQAAAVTGVTEIVGDNTPGPGENIVYESCFTNSGDETAYNPVFTATMPSNTTLDVTSVSIDGGSAITLVQTALAPTPSDLPYHYNTATRTLTVELSDIAAAGDVCVTFTAVLDDPLDAGEPVDFPAGSPELVYENADGDEYPGTEPIEDPGTFPGGGVVVDQTFGLTLDDAVTDAAFTGDPSDTLVFAFTLTNTGNGLDNFTFDDTSSFVTWVFYLDSDGDGELDAGEKTAGTITETGNLTDGSAVDYIAIGTIPAGTADASVDNVIITAISQGAAAESPAQVVTDSDTVDVTVTAPILTLVKSVTIDGTEYFNGDANSAAPGAELLYTIVVANSGTGVATTVIVSDAIPTNTTYVPESMTIDGTADDDDNTVDTGDGETEDHAEYTGTSVVFDFDTLDASGGTTDEHTLTFKVTIN